MFTVSWKLILLIFLFFAKLCTFATSKTKKNKLWLIKFQKNVLLAVHASMNVLLKQFLREISIKLMPTFALIVDRVPKFARLMQFLLQSNFRSK